MISSLFRYGLGFLLCVAVLLETGCGTSTQDNPADLVLRNGVIYTVDEERSRAEAVVVRGNEIVYVGSNDGVDAFVGPDTDVIDLNGKMVLPGFFDSHSHPPGGALIESVDVYLYGERSLEGYLNAVGNYAERNPDKTAIRGMGWSNALFPPTGPRKEDLDEIVSDRPVALTSGDGHSTWVNSKALEMAGITKDTPNPEGGVIEKDPDTGEPTGTLREIAAAPVMELLSPYTVEELMEGLVTFQKTANLYGVTTVHVAGVGFDAGYSSGAEAYKRLEESGRLTVRFRGSLLFNPDTPIETVPEFVEKRSQNTGRLFQTNAIKIFIDGVVEGTTAYLFEPYVHRPDYRGELLWDPDYLNEVCAALDKEGFQIHVHAIGDAATHVALNAFEHAEKANGKRDARPMITHLQLVAPEDKPRFGTLGVVGLPQPFWFQKGGFYENIEVPYLGEERASQEYPMQSLIDAGAVMASASDYPVTIEFRPLMGIQQAMTRAGEGVTDPDQILGPDERVGLEDMIASFTTNGAYANFIEKETGSLEVGKAADLVVVDQDLFEIPATEIGRATVLLTLFEGKEVFRSPEL